MSLPKTHKAIVLSSKKEPLDIALHDTATPTATPGSVIVKVLSTSLPHYLRNVYNGKLPYPMHLPLTPGGGAICRVVEVGTDATSLEPGQLVLVDIHVRARDDPSSSFLQGLFGGIGPVTKLMEIEWRNGSYAEYQKVPLENAYPLNEDILIKQMGYSVHDLTYALTLLVPFGGLDDTNVKPGDCVLVAPATGKFGGAAVTLALALGAKVIAAGRNEHQLKRMIDVLGLSSGGRFSYVKMQGKVEEDAAAIMKASPNGKGVDVYIDFSPPVVGAGGSDIPHIKSGLMALKTFGKVSFMGGIPKDVCIPYGLMMFKSLQITGRFMYNRGVIARLVSMLESGLVKVGPTVGQNVTGPYRLDRMQEAIEAAEKNAGWGNIVCLAPSNE